MAQKGYEEAIRLYVETAGDKELAALTEQLTKLGKGADVGAEQAQKLVAELDKLATTGNNLRSVIALKAAITETGTAIEAARDKQAALAAEFDRATAPTKAMENALGRAAAKVTELTRLQNRQQVELAKTTATLRSAGVDTDKLGDAYTQLQGDMDAFGKRAGATADELERAGRSGAAAARGVAQVDSAASRSAKSLGKLATGLASVSAKAVAAVAGLAGLGTGALFVGAVRSSTELEKALSAVRAVSGATADEMIALKAAAEAGGAATSFSALQAAEGLGELARATGSAQAAVAALPATLSLAQAAGIGVAEAAQFITTTLTQFGLGAEQAARVADVLAQASNSTTADVEGLGNALSYAAPLAKQLGVDTEGTVAIIGALADQGFRGERAGTALRNVFSEMLDPASDFAQALRNLGIESTDFSTVIEQLAAKGTKGRDALLSLDSAARPAILSLVASGGAALRSLDADLRNASGAAAATAAVMRDNLSGSVEALKDSFDRTRRSLVEPLMEPLRDELFALSKELDAFAQSPEFAEIKGALKDLFVEGAKAARELIDKVDFAKLATNIREAVGDAKGTIGEFTEQVGVLVDAVVIVGDTFSVVFNAIQTVVLGVAAVVTKIVSQLAKIGNALEAPGRALGEFFGILDEGEYSAANFAGGLDAVAAEFQGRFRSNLAETSAAVSEFGDRLDGASAQAAGAVDGVAVAGDRLAQNAEKIADATEAATRAMAAQARGATTAAQSTATAADSMAADAERLQKAFADLGVTSQTDLKSAADSASRNFDLITKAMRSGAATAEDGKRAFAAYAQAALAAVADSDAATQTRVRGELAVRGAAVQATDALKDLGIAGADAGASVATGARRATGALQEVGTAAEGAAAATQGAGDAIKKAGDNSEYGSKAGKQFALSMYEVSDAALRATMEVNKLAGTALFTSQLNAVTAKIDAQGDALRKQVEQLQAANAQYDELAGRRQQLANQYDMLGAGEIERLLQAEQQLESNRKRAAQERATAAAAAQPDVGAPVEIARAATATAASAVATRAVVDGAANAADALSDAAHSLRSEAEAPRGSGAPREIVVRVISEARAGAAEIKLSPATVRDITAAVIRELRQMKGVST